MKFYKSLFNIILIALSGAVILSASQASEMLRIRVDNRSGGVVEVSADGKTYEAIGKVLRPATGCIEGFSAASYVSNGVVAATAVHGIRIKTGEAEPQNGWEKRKPLMFSLVPFEFAATPKGFGGHIPHNSGIYTDIPAGKAIFRNLAPYVGNGVFVQNANDLNPIPADYSPSIGDVLVIIVTRPDRWLKEIDFENKEHGKVVAVYDDGTSELVTTVQKPVTGIGRYDGTSYTGRGRINTNHPGVLTISTAPVISVGIEGTGPESRGGFQIIPSYHIRFQQGISPQTMVVGPPKSEKPVLEGQKPLFCDYIGLSWDTVNDKRSFTAQVRIDEGDWESVPEIIGKVDNAFTAAGLNEYFRAKGIPRDAVKGVTHIRILFPSDDKEFILAEIRRISSTYKAAKASINGTNLKAKTVSGNYLMNPRFEALPYGSVVMFFVDGQVKKISAAAPHQYEWNTKTVENGEHTVDIRVIDSAGNILKAVTTHLVVKNN